LPRLSESAAKWIALASTMLVFIVSLCMLSRFDGSSAEFQFVEKDVWFPALGLTYHLGVDGISIYFVLLSTFLTPICLISAWKAIDKRVKEFVVAFLILETFMVGTF